MSALPTRLVADGVAIRAADDPIVVCEVDAGGNRCKYDLAAEIVRRYNAHEALVAACGQALGAIHGHLWNSADDEIPGLMRQAFSVIRDALRDAEANP